MESDTENSMVCIICHEVYRDPKFLPCHHTFCASCVQTWADHHRQRNNCRSMFPCPLCQKQASLPEGGAAALQTNFYLSLKDLDRARNGQVCLAHPKKELELYCVPCEKTICLKCKALDHNSHETVDPAEAVKLKKGELISGQQRVQKAMKTIKEMCNKIKSKLRRQEDQIATAQTVIRAMHGHVITSANVVRDKMLDYLQWQNGPVVRALSDDLQRLQENQHEMGDLDQQLTKAVNSEDMGKMTSLTEELKGGKGSKKSLNRMTSQRKTPPDLFQGFLFYTAVIMLFLIFLHLYFTNFHFSSQIGFHRMVEQFKCAEERDTEVFSICPTLGGTVWLSYAQRGLREDAASQEFNRTGRLVRTLETATGRVSWAMLEPESNIFISQDTHRIASLSKSGARFRLNNHLSGRAYVERVTRTFSEPHHVYVRAFKIYVKHHRAFDVDTSGNFVAVVEEGLSPDMRRKVKIYREPDAKGNVINFIPHSSTFQPSDVCFFRFAHQQLLLVADEWNNAILVLEFKTESHIFQDTLKSVCPPSSAPTALNVDSEGSLWVACRGGTIVKLQFDHPSFSAIVACLVVAVCTFSTYSIPGPWRSI